MKPIDNRLYLEFDEMVDAIATVEQKKAEKVEKYLRKSNSTGNRLLPFIKDPECRSKVLYDWKDMGPKYKAIVKARFGDPYDYVAKEPIRKLLEKDFKAEEFYLQYRYDGNKPLPIEHRNRYTTAASWLNLLDKLTADTRFIKKELGLTMVKFWDNIFQIISLDKIDLPTTPRNMRAARAKYKTDGYASLISWRFGNKQAAKVGKTEQGFDQELYNKQVAIIREASRKHQNYDAAQIQRAVNIVFDRQGWPTLSHTTVFNIVKQYRHLTTAGSRGKRVHDSTISMQVKRRAPEFPLLYCTLDGWTVELLYQDETGYNNRLVVVVVLDACLKYPIGYAIGDRENAELIRQANRNAILHLQQLFGNTYRPRQLQSDRYALKNLTPFYQALAHLHTPAAVGNAKSKIIEPYFKYLNEHYCQAFRNWSGHNVNAQKKNQPNVEYLDKIKGSFPDKAGVIRQIEMIIQQERLVKLTEYRKRWEAEPEDAKLVMSKMDWLAVFGTPHTHTNRIEGQGIIATLDGRKLTYDSFDPAFRSLQHLKWQLYFDQQDLREVLAVSEDGKNRFVLQEKHVVPMDIYSMNDEDRQWLKQVREYNEARKEEVIQTYIADDAIVQEVIQSTPLALSDWNESRVKLMFTTNGQQKESLQDAKGLKQVKAKQEKKEQAEARAQQTDWNNLQMQYLQSKTDFNQYLD